MVIIISIVIITIILESWQVVIVMVIIIRIVIITSILASWQVIDCWMVAVVIVNRTYSCSGISEYLIKTFFFLCRWRQNDG